MARLVKCDKCGAIVNLTDSRKVYTRFGEGPSNMYGNFEYEGKIFPAILEMEICVDCWKKFIKKSKKLFKPNK